MLSSANPVHAHAHIHMHMHMCMHMYATVIFCLKLYRRTPHSGLRGRIDATVLGWIMDGSFGWNRGISLIIYIRLQTR